MEIPIPDQLFSYWPLAALVGALSVIAAAVKVIRGAWDFHYDYFTRRHLKRMVELLPLAEEKSPQHDYLRKVIQSELFKIASGVNATDQKAAALIHLSNHSVISARELQRYSPFISTTEEGDIEVKIETVDKISAIYAGVCASGISLVGVISFLYLIWMGVRSNSFLPMLFGSVLFVILAYIVRFFLNDVARYRNAKKIRDRLSSRPIPPCVELKRINS